ncbi:hypothetical protein [Rubritepida flocculans]|jgi:hypothetical protein|uniref:hypothetical protein n=1 Tax=Rubritepida flocculans TaxID=182403 RepID=UPI000420A2F2|nr:hypothetical protein [Rubritepida flocculans]
MRRWRLRGALHETGHALFMVLGFVPVRRLIMGARSGRAERDTAEIARRRAAPPPDWGQAAPPPEPCQQTARLVALERLAISAAGAEAEAWRARLRPAFYGRRVAAMGASNFSVTDARTAIAASARLRELGVDAEAPRLRDALDQHFQRAFDRHRFTIARTARRLYRKGRLEGEELAELLRPIERDTCWRLEVMADLARALADPLAAWPPHPSRLALAGPPEGPAASRAGSFSGDAYTGGGSAAAG